MEGLVITLVNRIVRLYDAPFGLVQLVRIPQYTDITFSQPVTALPWNGVIGGVVSFAVSLVVGFFVIRASVWFLYPEKPHAEAYEGFGEATLLTERSACAVVPTIVFAVALLFAPLGSGTAELIFTVSLITVPFETKFEVIAEPAQQEWIQVRLPDDRSGWVQLGDVAFDAAPLSIPAMRKTPGGSAQPVHLGIELSLVDLPLPRGFRYPRQFDFH